MKTRQKIPLILFGLFLTIVILEIVLRISGFAISSLQEYRNLQSIKQKGSCRIMCLGESTTQKQYPACLEEILNQRNIGIKFSVIDKGLAGTNTVAILAKLEANLDKYQPDIVVTMMGVNDNGKHMPYEIAYSSKLITALRSFKVYKFTRLLWLHMVTKSKKVCEKFQQEQSFNKAKKVNPNNDSAYAELGWFYKDQGKFSESEDAFNKAIKLNPHNNSSYAGLSRLYIDHEKFAKSEQVLKKAIELNPKSDCVYAELGWLYQCQRKEVESEQAYKKAIELNPNNAFIYQELSRLYRHQEKLVESEQMFKKAIELIPNDGSAYIELGMLYRDQGKLVELEQIFKKDIELNPNNECSYGSLARIYCDMGNNELSKMYAEKANSLRNESYNPKTFNNYHILKQILDKRKIKLVCMQYPMRNIAPLKKIFKEEPEGNIIFVDNERIFKDAIRKEGYKEYFKDMFGGDFGHCTDKGNKLLAENIASVILKEIFNK